ncbi:LpqB family beta-propeller domain-containing protein [Sphaerisporangium sp. NPDC051017]|uniref:LpqB family beta-propeller domain-containing protein n=1 Tax=Sphaerisporangium sp. NPDC051017 TaxID=3154636 RepID=UPI00342F228B
MPTRRSTAGLCVLAMAALAVASSACSTVRTGGNIFTAHDPGKNDPLSQPYVRILPAPPKPDATSAEIVSGFLAAAASFDDPTRTVAKQYLTSDAQRTWSPFDPVTVYDQAKLTTDGRGDDLTQAHVQLKGIRLGELDRDSHYVPRDASANNDLTLGFILVRVRGQWRISTAPSGLQLSNDDFKRAYRSFDLYFAAGEEDGLVSDQVWLPINPNQGLAKTLVQRLLVGPTTPLKGAVDSAFGGQVDDRDVNDVTVEGDTVVVDFTSDVVGAARVARYKRALSAQLSWTLKPLTEARRIEVRVNGEQFPGGPFIIDPRDYKSYDPNVVDANVQALFLRQGRLFVIDKDKDEPFTAGTGPARQLTSLAVADRSFSRVAGLEKGGGRIWVTGTAPGNSWQRWMEAPGLTSPSWDRHGDLWSVSRTGPRRSQVLRAREPGSPILVSAPDLEGTDVTAFRVARDGVRVAVVSDDGHGQQVLVGTISRSRTEVRNVHTLFPAEAGRQVADIAWRDASTLLVLTKNKNDRQLTAVSVTQRVTDTPRSAAGIETITAAPDPAPVLAGTSDGQVLMWDTQKRQWTPVEKNGASAPMYPLG